MVEHGCDRLPDPCRSRDRLARHRIRCAPCVGRAEPDLYRCVARHPLHPQLPDAADRALYPWPAAGCLHSGDYHDRAAQSADAVVASRPLDLRNPPGFHQQHRRVACGLLRSAPRLAVDLLAGRRGRRGHGAADLARYPPTKTSIANCSPRRIGVACCCWVLRLP